MISQWSHARRTHLSGGAQALNYEGSQLISGGFGVIPRIMFDPELEGEK